VTKRKSPRSVRTEKTFYFVIIGFVKF